MHHLKHPSRARSQAKLTAHCTFFTWYLTQQLKELNLFAT